VAGQVQLWRPALAELENEGEDDELVLAGRARRGQGCFSRVLAPVYGDSAGVARNEERQQEDGNELEGSERSACHGTLTS
jgi:hypothetical protein